MKNDKKYRRVIKDKTKEYKRIQRIFIYILFNYIRTEPYSKAVTLQSLYINIIYYYFFILYYYYNE